MKAGVPQASTPTVTTKTTTITSEPRSQMPDFWEYLEHEIPRCDPNWDKHLLYIYRTDPGPSAPIGKFVRAISVPGQREVPLDDREQLEWGIRELFGGRAFRLILKRGSERITEGKCFNDAAPRNPPAIPDSNVVMPSMGMGNMSDPTASVARDAIHTLGGRDSEAMRVAVGALQATADMVTRMTAVESRPPAPHPQNDLMQQVMVAVVQKAMNPPDPMETFTRMLTLVRESQPHAPAVPPGAGGTGFSAVDKIIEKGLDRILNPPPPPSAGVSMGGELMRALPAIGQQVVMAMQEWRLGMQAQAEAMRAAAAPMRNPPPATLKPALPAASGPVQVSRPGPLPGTTLTMPTQATAGAPQQTLLTMEPAGAPPAGVPIGGDMTPPFMWIETKLVEFLRDSPTVDEAVDKFAAFLELSAPNIIDQLLGFGKETVGKLFQTEPVLREGTAGMPPERITEFLDKFFSAVSEPAEESATKPN
jgi:hypothetical protein